MAGPEGQPTPNDAIRDFVVGEGGPKEWKHKEYAQELYALGKIIDFAFFSPKDEQQAKLPTIVHAVEKMRVEILGAYHLVPDGLGISYKVAMNEVWIARPWWEQAETLTHEHGHVYQNEVLGEKSKNNYHDKNFVDIMGELGIHVKLGEGYHLRPADSEGQFGRLMALLGIERPLHADPEDGGDFILPPGGKNWFDGDRGKKKGKSTLLKYSCETCTRAQACNFRAGKADLKIGCLDCGGTFKPEGVD